MPILKLKTTDDPAPLKEPGARTRHLCDALRKPLGAFSGKFELVRESCKELAPKVEKAYLAYVHDTSGGLLQFVRYLNPSVPLERKGYRAHPTYQAVQYLRRLAVAEREPKPLASRPVSILHAFAQYVAAVEAVLDANGLLWAGFVREMRWTPRRASNILRLGQKLGASEAMSARPATTRAAKAA